MKTVSLLSVLEIPVGHVRQTIAGAGGGGYGLSGWWPGPAFPGWGVGWPGMIEE